MMKLHTVHAIYRDGQLIFDDEQIIPQNGSEVVVTYVVADEPPAQEYQAAFEALCGRAKGERLREKLLAARREDREREQR